MLPFLDKKKATGLVVSRRGKPDMEVGAEVGGDIPDGLHDAALDILQAIKENKPISLAQALQHAFQICDTSPHDEGEQLNEE